MSALEKAIKKAKGKLGIEPSKKTEKCSTKMEKAISAAHSRISELQTSEILEKGGMDAMFHHALHAKAAQSASYGDPGKPCDPESGKELQEKAKKHEFMMLRHALEEARRKSSGWVGSMSSKLRKYADFVDGESYDMEKDPEFEKAKSHYKKGGEFKGHKDDKFKEDY